jgi:type II secretory pathway pseudopilin PulG
MLLHWKPKRHHRGGFTLAEVLISFFVFSLVMAGLIYGYVQINRVCEMNSMSLAAQSFASQGLEEAASVQWDYRRWPSTNANSQDPFWTSVGSTSPPPQVDTLDVPTSGTPIYVTNYVTVTDLGTYLPLRQIRCDCVWSFPLDGTMHTNSAISIRTPDQ